VYLELGAATEVVLFTEEEEKREGERRGEKWRRDGGE
jgi:hypothetical protein